jgi:hypothetical protein
MAIPNDSLGNYKIMTPDFVRALDTTIDIAAGRFVNLKAGTKFGINPDIDTTSDPEDVWEGGGDYTGHPVSFTPETIDVFSDTGFDSSADEGARTITIFGLTDTGATEYTSETLTLNGVVPVTSTNTWWRVNRCFVATAGSQGANAGVITVRSTTTTANVFASMLVGYNQTNIGAYTVPHKKSLILKNIRVSITPSGAGSGAAIVTLRYRQRGGVYRAIRSFNLGANAPVDQYLYAGECLNAGSDIKFRVEEVTANDTEVEGSFEWLEIAE